MSTESSSRSASADENRLAARHWIDAFNARDDEGEAGEQASSPAIAQLSTELGSVVVVLASPLLVPRRWDQRPQAPQL